MTRDLIRYWSRLVNESEDAESNNRFVEGFDKLSDANKEYALKILTLCMDKKKMKQHMELSEYRGTTQRDYEVFLKMLYDYKWNST